MCGIAAYVGKRNALKVLLSALERLEYRGYDSAGISIIQGGIKTFKTKGSVEDLRESIPQDIESHIGIGHTRWATHGVPSTRNAHPHLDCKGMLAVVHNGIIENYASLKEELEKKGHVFVSDTDTEVVAHLLEEKFKGDMLEAIQEAMDSLEGSYALAIIDGRDEERIYGVRMYSPLILAIGEGENFLASDIPAILPYTNKVIYLDDGDIVCISKDSYTVMRDGKRVEKEVHLIDWDVKRAEKAGYKHFMLKEIHEQPRVIRDTLAGRLDLMEGKVIFPELEKDERFLSILKRIVIPACGTSLHAGTVAKHLLERYAGTPTEVVQASEFRYSDIPLDRETLLIAISQSGETADTLAAVRKAKKHGTPILAITNVVGSSITRSADYVLYTRAGPEIGVAATKTFTAQLVLTTLLALYLASLKKRIPLDTLKEVALSLADSPSLVAQILEKEGEIRKLAEKYVGVRDFFFLGRGINYPIALEGALKMKEISYIHAEGFPAGELKHGPLALLGRRVPVLALVPRDRVYEKMLSNIKEVKARDSEVIAVAFKDDLEVEKYVDRVIRIPPTLEEITPILNGVVVQLLAYHIADLRQCEIDKPRHLAKSVTVE